MARPNFNQELTQMARVRCRGAPGHVTNAYQLYCPGCLVDYASECYDRGIREASSDSKEASYETETPGNVQGDTVVEDGGMKVTVGGVRMVPEDEVPVQPQRTVGERTKEGEFSEGEYSQGGEFVKEMRPPEERRRRRAEKAIKEDIKEGLGVETDEDEE